MLRMLLLTIVFNISCRRSVFCIAEPLYDFIFIAHECNPDFYRKKSNMNFRYMVLRRRQALFINIRAWFESLTILYVEKSFNEEISQLDIVLLQLFTLNGCVFHRSMRKPDLLGDWMKALKIGGGQNFILLNNS